VKVVLALHGWPPEDMGGTGLYVDALARSLQGLGHHVELLAPGDAGPPALRHTTHDGLAGRRLELPAPERWHDTWRRGAALPLLRAWLRESDAEVLHVHHLSGLPLGLPALARELGLRVVISLHDYALPCARGQLLDRALEACEGPAPARCGPCLGVHLALDPLSKAVAAPLARLPGLRARAHAVASQVPVDERPLLSRDAAVARALRAAHVLHSPSRDLAGRFVTMGHPRPTVLDLPLLRPLPPAPAAGPGPVRFLFASSIIPSKGPDVLLEAFRALPPGVAQLSFAGPAPAYDGRPGFGSALADAVHATPHTRWLGPLPHSEIAPLLAAHDVLVLPSRWPENSPVIVREATAAGLRTILSAVGGANELDHLARLVAPGDIGALVDALSAEVALGRGRRPPKTWETPRSHAQRVVSHLYESARDPESSTR